MNEAAVLVERLRPRFEAGMTATDLHAPAWRDAWQHIVHEATEMGVLFCGLCGHDLHGAEQRPDGDVRCNVIVGSTGGSMPEPTHCPCLDWGEVVKVYHALRATQPWNALDTLLDASNVAYGALMAQAPNGSTVAQELLDAIHAASAAINEHDRATLKPQFAALRERRPPDGMLVEGSESKAAAVWDTLTDAERVLVEVAVRCENEDMRNAARAVLPVDAWQSRIAQASRHE